ncbi:MAG: hypothetical protein KDJ29_03780 [Hyphomicrobiales bacterium]|nr:hypothetical protein [Hyphomicrobiales bacterium]
MTDTLLEAAQREAAAMVETAERQWDAILYRIIKAGGDPTRAHTARRDAIARLRYEADLAIREIQNDN